MLSYQGFQDRLKEKGIHKSDLSAILGISSRTIAKIGKGEKLSRIVMEKLCTYFSCAPEDLCREVSDNPILQILREEKDAGISGNRSFWSLLSKSCFFIWLPPSPAAWPEGWRGPGRDGS